jgi:hypothetical protein
MHKTYMIRCTGPEGLEREPAVEPRRQCRATISLDGAYYVPVVPRSVTFSLRVTRRNGTLSVVVRVSVADDVVFPAFAVDAFVGCPEIPKC